LLSELELNEFLELVGLVIGCPKRPKISQIRYPVFGPRKIGQNADVAAIQRRLPSPKTGERSRAILDALD